MAIERDLPGNSRLPLAVSLPSDGTPVLEPSHDEPTAEHAARTSEIKPAEPPPTVRPTEAIESVLKNYAIAVSARDVGAAKSVWPAVDERALARAFDGLQEQRFELGSCDIRVEGSAAIATCVGTAQYRPKVGVRSMRSERRAWTFHLGLRNDTWSIENVDVR